MITFPFNLTPLDLAFTLFLVWYIVAAFVFTMTKAKDEERKEEEQDQPTNQ